MHVPNPIHKFCRKKLSKWNRKGRESDIREMDRIRRNKSKGEQHTSITAYQLLPQLRHINGIIVTTVTEKQETTTKTRKN